MPSCDRLKVALLQYSAFLLHNKRDAPVLPCSQRFTAHVRAFVLRVAVKNRVTVAKEALEAAQELQEALSVSLSDDSSPEERAALEQTQHQISRCADIMYGTLLLRQGSGRTICATRQLGSLSCRFSASLQPAGRDIARREQV